MTNARDERTALCALLDRTGPAEPTLCEGWSTVDLAAHLVLREHRPDAGLGMLGGPLERHTRRLQSELAQRTPFPRLVATIRSGPPRLSVFGIPGVDERANAVEYFVHHEDVLRAQRDWQPRDLSRGLSDMLWERLKIAKLILRKAPVGVELAREDQPQDNGAPGGGPLQHDGTNDPAAARHVRITAKARTPVVTVTGTPAELTMWVYGRTGAAHVRLEGGDADVRALRQSSWRL
jgi:uncharacterized protein (TIGR03085 family)